MLQLKSYYVFGQSLKCFMYTENWQQVKAQLFLNSFGLARPTLISYIACYCWYAALCQKKHPCSQKIAAFQSELAREDKQLHFVPAVVGNNEQSTFYLKPDYKNLKIFAFSLLLLDRFYLKLQRNGIYSIYLGAKSSKITKLFRIRVQKSQSKSYVRKK